MLQVLGMVVALCAGCGDPQEPRGLRIAIPDPIVDLGVSDGCARFQVRFDAGGAPILEPIFNSASCALNQIRLLSDTAATFDAATGALRVAIVMENLGTAAIVPRVQLRFNADSVTRLDANGNPVGGANDILGYQPDSASANGRIAFWRFDGYLAPVGQPQVLMPGARTQRRWVEFRGTTWSHRTRLKLFATGQEAGLVPAAPPDTIPPGFFDASNQVPDPLIGDAPILRDIIQITFADSTSQHAKQSAVSGIGAVVVGGIRVSGTTGVYFVRMIVPQTVAQLHAAVAIVAAAPGVEDARVVIAIPDLNDYLRPVDGVGWAGWQVRPSYNGTGNKEALERLNAPLAWGCSVGDSLVRVAVVDNGIGSNADIAYNRSRSVGIDSVALGNHGTRTSSILAATGNNGIGMTGVAWRADLRAYERSAVLTNGQRSLNPAATAKMIERAVTEGARVVNVSASIAQTWTTNGAPGTTPFRGGTAADRLIADTVSGFYVPVLRRLIRAGFDPLIVVVSGNFTHPSMTSTDVRYSGWWRLKQLYPNNVLVVGAEAEGGGLLPGSGRGAGVSVVALGDNVHSLSSSSMSTSPDRGTSFAAPQVAGIAVLLLAFDPTLTAQRLIQLVEQGAVMGGRTAGGIPIANAYASLRLAAERPGAPLCGNRMWSDGSQLLVRRGTATEVIGTRTLLEPNIESYHGGRVAGFGGVRFVWQPNGSWAAGSLPAGSVPSGAWRSSVGASHDGDSTVYTTIGPVPVGGGHFDVIVDHYAGAALLSSRTVTSGNAGANTPVLAHVAYPTTGNTALVAVARGTITLPLPSPPVIALDAGTAYGLSLSTGQVSTLWVESGRGILAVGYSEDGSEIVSVVSNAYNFVGQPLVAMPSCKVTWRKVSAPAVVIDSASTPYGCQIDPIAGARTGGSAPRILPRRP